MSEESQCCECAEEMADQLERFENFFSVVFEGENNQTVVFGTIREVIDGEVLHMEDVQKQIILDSGNTFNFFFNDLYISICEINQFSPLFEVTAATAGQVATLQNQVLQNTNATRII